MSNCENRRVAWGALPRPSGMELVIIAGLGMTILINLLYLWGGWVFDAATVLNFKTLLLIWSIPHLLMNALVFLAVALSARRPFLRSFKPVVVVSGSLLLFGHSLLLFFGNTGQLAIITAAALCIGAGASLLLIVWVRVFGALAYENRFAFSLYALVVGTVLFEIIDHLDSLYRAFLLPLLIVVAAIATLKCLHSDSGGSLKPVREKESAIPKDTPSIGQIVRSLRDPLFCIVAVAFAIPLMRVIPSLDGTEIDEINNASMILVLVVVSLILFIRYGLRKYRHPFRNFSILQFYRVSLPIVATVFVLYAVFGNSLALVVSASTFVLFYLVWILLIPTSVELADKLDVSSLVTYGIMNFVANLISAAATCLCIGLYLKDNRLEATTLGASAIMLLVLYVFMLVVTFLNKQDQADRAPVIRSSGESSTVESRMTTVGQSMDKSVSDACEELGGICGLTSRERTVLHLLAQGRDSPYIARKLYISKNTVRTHVKNIYMKLDIHDKQALLDLIESVRRQSPK